MTVATTAEGMSPKLLKVAERAKREPEGSILSLARLIDEAALKRAFVGIRKNAAVGVDGVTKEQYGRRLEENLQGLHERLRRQRYRHQAVRRVHIPKGQGKTRPIGVSNWWSALVPQQRRSGYGSWLLSPNSGWTRESTSAY